MGSSVQGAAKCSIWSHQNEQPPLERVAGKGKGKENAANGLRTSL